MRMKQLWALLLALSLLCSLTLPALAEDDEGEETPALSEDEVSLADLSPIPIEAPPDAEIQASSIRINSSNFPDSNFRNYLINTYGVKQSIFSSTYYLDPDAVDRLECAGLGISNLSGIEKFPNLTYLNCSGNTGLRSVDIRQSSALMDAVVNWRHVENNGVITFESKGGMLVMSSNTALTGFHKVTIDFACEGVDPYVLYVEDGKCLVWPEGLEEPEREGYLPVDYYVGTPGAYYDWDTPVTQDFTLTLLWIKVWTVTYDFNGGTMNGVATSDSFLIQDGETPSTKLNIKKEGQIFICWLLNGEPYEPAPVHSDITLVAKWGDPFKLIFDRSSEHDDHHTDIPDILAGELGSSEVSFMYFYGLHSPILSDDGDWQFLGWDTDAEAAPDRVAYPLYQNGASDKLTGRNYNVRLGEDTTLYPIYGKAPTITVNKNDGMDTDITSDVVRSRGVYSYIMIGKTSYTTLDGYTLLGYSTDHKAEVPDPGLEANSNGNTRQVYYYAAEDLTLYAVWAANSYTVSYDRSGGSGRLPEAISFTLDDKPEIVLPSAEDLGLTKAHRVFLGWSVDASKSDQNCNKVPSGLYAPGDTLDPAVLSAKNHTIYAVWQYEAIKISLDLNGYTGVYTPANGYPMYYNYGWTNGYDVPAGRPVTPLSYPGDKAFPEGYAAAEGAANPFRYWMDKDTGQFYTNGISANRDNGTAVLPNDKDTELLGVWEYAFLRYYDANGEVALVDAVVFDADTKTYTRPTVKAGIERVGYEFLGWATEQGGEVVYQPGDTIDSLAEISFYPVYQLNATTVVLRSASVVFDGLIRLRYYFTLPDPLLDAGDSYLVFYKRGEEMNRTALKDGTPVNKSGDPSNKSFDLSVVAKAFDDEIVIKILDADGNAYPMVTENGADYTEIGFPYSVRQYAEYLQGNSSSATMQALAKALVEYGDAARIYFGGSGTVSDDVMAVTLDDFDGCAVKKSGVLPTGVTGKSISVMFEADNSLRIYLDFAPEYSPDDYSFTIDGEPATMQENADHKFYLTVRNIAAKNLDVFHTFTVSDGVRSFSIEASVLSYARLLVSGNKPNSQNLGKALYLYNLAADALFQMKR